jgi:hypothetical protein
MFLRCLFYTALATRQEFSNSLPNRLSMTKTTLTRRDLARKAFAGAAGALLTSLALPARSQVVDPMPAIPPPLPSPAPMQNQTPAQNSIPTQSQTPMTTPTTEGSLLIQLVPIAAGYTLTDTQAKEVALQLKDYPGGFAKARAYALTNDIGPAFAADAPVRKERVK